MVPTPLRACGCAERAGIRRAAHGGFPCGHRGCGVLSARCPGAARLLRQPCRGGPPQRRSVPSPFVCLLARLLTSSIREPAAELINRAHRAPAAAVLELVGSDPGPHLEQLHEAMKDCLTAAGLHTSPAPPLPMHARPVPDTASACSGTTACGRGTEDAGSSDRPASNGFGR